MRKTILLLLALVAAGVTLGSTPRAVADGCDWVCDEFGSVHCSCGHPRLCTWPPPPIVCPTP